MRGEWGEFVPWQVPMGLGTPKVLEAMDIKVFRADYEEEVGFTVDAAANLHLTQIGQQQYYSLKK